MPEVEELQRRQAGCKRGSVRYRRLSDRIARIQAKAARQRREALHVWTTSIAREFRDLEIVAPPVAEVTTSGHGNEREWGAATDLKAELNRRVLDQAPARAIQMLEYKVAEGGGAVAIIRDDAPPAAIGNEIVAATKETRRLRRAIHAR